MPRLKLIVKDKPSPAPAPPPPVRGPARVTKPDKTAHRVSPPSGNTLPPYRRLTIEDLLSPAPPPPPPPAVEPKPARFETLADIDLKADTAALDVLACVCDLFRSDPLCEEEVMRQWRQTPEWKRRGLPDPDETEEDVEMLAALKAASEERPTKRPRVDEKWEEPPGPTFSFPRPKPERNPKDPRSKPKDPRSKPKDPRSEPRGPGRARPRHLRANPRPSRQLIEQ